jgi:hypothetical protein
MTNKKTKEPKKLGRPTNYNEEIATRICELTATHTMGYRRIEKLYPDLPSEQTVREWRLAHYKTFGVQYAQAKALQAELLAEECLDIADDSRNDWMESLDEEDKGDGFKLNSDHINRCRLRIDTRKWHASKLLPKIYGDFKNVELPSTELDDDCKKRYAEMDKRNRKDY